MARTGRQSTTGNPCSCRLQTLGQAAALKVCRRILLPPAYVLQLQLHQPYRLSTFLASVASLLKVKAAGPLQHPAQNCNVLGLFRPRSSSKGWNWGTKPLADTVQIAGLTRNGKTDPLWIMPQRVWQCNGLLHIHAAVADLHSR